MTSETHEPKLVWTRPDIEDMTNVPCRITPARQYDMEEVIRVLDEIAIRAENSLSSDNPILGICAITIHKDGSGATVWSEGALKHIPGALGLLRMLDHELCSNFVETYDTGAIGPPEYDPDTS